MNWDLPNSLMSARIGSLGVGTIIILLAIAALVFGFFYLLKKYIVPLLESDRALRKTKLLVFRIEVLTWLIYALITLTQLFTESIWVTTALLVVVGLVGLNFWRDFFPGLLMRVSDKFRKNDPVRFEEYVGVIEKLGKVNVHLRTEEEELIFIPYRKISNGIFIKRQAKGKLISSRIILQIGSKDPDEMIEKVNKWILECPWAIPQGSNNAGIQPGGLLHVTVYAVDSVSLGKVERYVKSRIDSL